jgi:hypothetical protein
MPSFAFRAALFATLCLLVSGTASAGEVTILYEFCQHPHRGQHDCRTNGEDIGDLPLASFLRVDDAGDVFGVVDNFAFELSSAGTETTLTLPTVTTTSPYVSSSQPNYQSINAGIHIYSIISNSIIQVNTNTGVETVLYQFPSGYDAYASGMVINFTRTGISIYGALTKLKGCDVIYGKAQASCPWGPSEAYELVEDKTGGWNYHKLGAIPDGAALMILAPGGDALYGIGGGGNPACGAPGCGTVFKVTLP